MIASGLYYYIHTSFISLRMDRDRIRLGGRSVGRTTYYWSGNGQVIWFCAFSVVRGVIKSTEMFGCLFHDALRSVLGIVGW